MQPMPPALGLFVHTFYGRMFLYELIMLTVPNSEVSTPTQRHTAVGPFGEWLPIPKARKDHFYGNQIFDQLIFDQLFFVIV